MPLFFSLICLSVSAGPAAADFSGTVSGLWVNPAPDGAWPAFTGVGTNAFRWGDASGYAAPASSLWFSGYSLAGVPEDTAAALGELTYYNGTIANGTGASRISLMLNISISDPGYAAFTPEFSLELVNVPNNGSEWENADYVYFPSVLSNQTFTLNGTRYRLEILGFSQDYGRTLVKQFHVLEDEQTSAVLYGRITRNSVYYLPYFAAGDGWWSGVALRNINNWRQAPVTTYIYRSDGALLDREYTDLPARGQTSFVAGSGMDAIGWIKVVSGQPLAGLSFFGNNSGYSYMADIPFASDLSASLVVPHVAQNAEWDTYVMVCNPNDDDTTVSLVLVDTGGQVAAAREYWLAANGSGIYALDDLLNGGYGSGSLEISANQGVAAFALYTDYEKTETGYNYAGIAAVDPDK